MKIGSRFELTRSGDHEKTQLIILHDKRKNERFVYNINMKLQHGTWIILYADFLGVASKEEINKYTDEFDQRFKK